MTVTKVLVVEDEGVVALDLQHQLTRLGYMVPAVAATGEDALRLVAETAPDIVLMDIRLAGELDGIEAAALVRAQFATPVIFLTAHSDDQTLARAKQTQPLGYLIKPLRETELKPTIVMALMRHQLEQQERAHTQRLQQEIEARQRVEVALAHERDQLRHYVTELETRNADLDAFAQTVAHDLQNPLSVILGYAWELAEYDTTIPKEQLCDGLTVIVQSGQRMNRIIAELLLLASVVHTDEKLRSFDMATIVAAAQQRLTEVIAVYQAEIVLPATWPLVMGYAAWVEEVWANYLDNAIKYGGQPPRVTLGANRQSDGMVRFWVRDNGSGLTSEEQGRLFVPFTRLAQAQATGHGLGLSIVRRIVEKLGGQVGVESQVGQGSTFFFTLPAANDQSGCV